MKRRTLIKSIFGTIPVLAVPKAFLTNDNPIDFQQREAIPDGPFQPSWNSLKQYKVPDWFRDAKFGIWAHWGPQCQPEHGDWYARSMYMEGSDDYQFHLKKYGHPSVFGFKDVINQWKAEKWNPDQLLELYKRAGAKYFVALANHHDNFDTYDSKFQSWNSVNQGPRKDLIGGWVKAARGQGLRFGVSVHAAHAWLFYEEAQKSDHNGPYAGVPYDGKLTKVSGKNTWWEGLDPQELYAQNHAISAGTGNQEIFFKQWDWSSGVSVPDKKYCEKFFNRTVDLIDQYNPDLVYFDDTILPLWPVSDVGLRIAAHFYNRNMKFHKGSLEAVLTGKILNEEQRKCMVWDIERGQSNYIEPLPWQTDTCIGNWHYDRQLFEKNGYKKASTIIHRLADVVSKNGNLLLSVPVRGDGTLDPDEVAIVESIAVWIKKNGESIFETRPWKVFGEGPAIASAAALTNQGFNEDSRKPFTGEDIRFTVKGDILYAIGLGAPVGGELTIKTLADGSSYFPQKIAAVKLVENNQQLNFRRTSEGLIVSIPENLHDSFAYSVKILHA